MPEMINTQFCMPPYISNENLLTTQTYSQMYYRIERLALNVFKWRNLPYGLKSMIIERYLFYFGRVALFYDEVLEQFVALPVTGEFAWDVDYYPTAYEVTGFGGYRRMLDYTNSVLLYNDYQMSPGSEMASIFATRLTNSLRTSDMHLELQKIGKVITAPETKRKGFETILKKIKNFAATVIASPAAMDMKDSIQVLDTELDFIVDKLDGHYTFMWHDVLNYLGIDSMSDKQSGVNPLESKAEAAMAQGNRMAMKNAREEGIEKFNEMFGQNVELEFLGKEDGQNGELYDDSEDSDGDSGREDESSNL